MYYRVRFALEAEAALIELYEFILEHDAPDFSRAERALDAIKLAVRHLETSPFSYRKAMPGNPFLRELVIPFGAAGYVALFEIDSDQSVTVIAVRHQREDDYH